MTRGIAGEVSEGSDKLFVGVGIADGVCNGVGIGASGGKRAGMELMTMGVEELRSEMPTGPGPNMGLRVVIGPGQAVSGQMGVLDTATITEEATRPGAEVEATSASLPLLLLEGTKAQKLRFSAKPMPLTKMSTHCRPGSQGG